MSIDRHSWVYRTAPSDMARQHRINCICVVLALMCLLQNKAVSGTDVDFSLSSRILGGSEVYRGDWPFIVALYRAKTSQYFCGGTLISSQHILTGKRWHLGVIVEF